MLDVEDFLLNKIAEEANELAQRAMKQQQYGAYEVEPGQGKNNMDRLHAEYNDLRAVMDLLNTYRGLPMFTQEPKAKAERMLEFVPIGINAGKISPNVREFLEQVTKGDWGL